MNEEWIKRLSEIDVRVSASTPGPWTVSQNCDEYNRLINAWCVPQIDVMADMEQCDADFIAHARDDVPWLLVIIDVLSANNDMLVKIGREQNVKIDKALELHPDLASVFRNTYWDDK